MGKRIQPDVMKVRNRAYQFTAIDDCIWQRTIRVYPNKRTESTIQILPLRNIFVFLCKNLIEIMFANRLLIIGNGFDLDLGLKTSYSDFIESDNFKSIAHKYQLLDFLSEKFHTEKWIDLENFLRLFAEQYKTGKALPKDTETAFEKLRDSLCQYLTNIDFQLKTESVAATLLKEVVDNGYFQILSFNYTDINQILLSLNIPNKDVQYTYIHGNLKDKSIIIGFQDDVDVAKPTYFMIKSHSPYYRSCNVRAQLEEADEIIFFGHSLGATDYHYFSDFFKQQSDLTSKKVKPKKIRIFTYNESSRQEILAQLRGMNEHRINYLYDLNDLRIYRTMEDQEDIKLYFRELQENGIEAHRRILDRASELLL